MNNPKYDKFMEKLYKKYSQKSQLINALTGLLFITKEVAYKRANKDIPFTVNELITIASEWNISLDNIIDDMSKHIDFSWVSLNYFNPSDDELQHVQNVISHLNNIDNCRDAEYMEVGNKLPQALVAGFPYIIRYQILKWACLYTNQEKILWQEW